MALFAEINDKKIVLRVITVNDLVPDGANFCHSLFGGVWLETYLDGGPRKNYAGIGFIYDPIRNAFIPPKPFDSWVLDEIICQWKPPVSYPSDGGDYEWDNISQRWVNVNRER